MRRSSSIPPTRSSSTSPRRNRRACESCGTLETHTHADHVSGHGRLALEHGVPVSIHPAAEAAYEHDPLEDGQEIVLGNVALRVLHTPGHRPEHCCFAVLDRTRAEEPWLVLTGDSLFVGDSCPAGPGGRGRRRARELYESLQRLLELPDGVEVFPGHVAGSLCGASMSSKASTTIGFERRFNPMLTVGSEDEFVTESALTRSPRPPNLERIVGLNRGRFPRRAQAARGAGHARAADPRRSPGGAFRSRPCGRRDQRSARAQGLRDEGCVRAASRTRRR